MDRIRAMIVDDMPLAIASLKADIEDNFSDELEIVATAEGVMDAAKNYKKLKPDLIFLDIHMGDGDGFDLLEIIQRENACVVFTTASKDFAIKAFQVSAVDYLLKPIDLELLKAAVAKVKKQILERMEIPGSIQSDGPKTISLSTQEELRIVAFDNIIRLEALGNYTRFFLADGSKILVTKTLKEFEKALDAGFIRVHQSHLVNRSHIKAYVKTEGGYLEMKDKSIVPVSVRKKPYVIELLSK
jgi:two-component system LytT family response regulator